MISDETMSIIPIGGVGDVTKNMYLYEYKDQILIVDCGLGFADETMLGVDLLLPDISYLQKTNKKIVGLIFTHGHEDHIGALPFILPQLSQSFPLYGTPLTAALANEKLKEFDIPTRVTTVQFDDPAMQLGAFEISFIRITHSVPDSSNILIKTPVGNFYHGSDFKFDFTPETGKRSDLIKIASAGKSGIRCLLSDCLGSERAGFTPSEELLTENFEKEMRRCEGKFIVTTYSSNISRLNQAIAVAQQFNRKIAFIGRSLIKAKDAAKQLGYLQIKPTMEIQSDQIKNYKDNQLMLLVAGSQGQENSAMARIANGEHRDVKLSANDAVVFSADPIPGNEKAVHGLVDTIAKKGARVVYSGTSDDFHVSGHGSAQDLLLMMSLTSPKQLLPIGGTYRQMVAYKGLAQKLGYKKHDILLLEDGQEVIFSKDTTKLGKKIELRNVYVDEISGEEIESYVLRDRKKLSEGGVVIAMLEVEAATGQLINHPDIIIRGFVAPDARELTQKIVHDIKAKLGKKQVKVTDWTYVRRNIGDAIENRIFRELRRHPLVLPIVIEV